TQSGETADTLAAMEEARKRGARLLTLVNVMGSEASRVSDDVIYLHTGPEIAVASTKAYTAMLVDLYLFAIYLTHRHGATEPRHERSDRWGSAGRRDRPERQRVQEDEIEYGGSPRAGRRADRCRE